MTTKFSLFTGHSYRLRPGCLYSSLLSAWAGLLGCFRFPGQSNCDLRKIAVNLIPHSHVFMRGMRLMAIPSPLALFLPFPLPFCRFPIYPSLPLKGEKGQKGNNKKQQVDVEKRKRGKGKGTGTRENTEMEKAKVEGDVGKRHICT